MIAIESIRLYLPDEKLHQRLGGDVGALNRYIVALRNALALVVGGLEPVGAKGLLVAVGVKPGQRARVWCDVAEGEIPAERVGDIKHALGAVPTIVINQGPIAFAIECRLRDQGPVRFPVFPRAWVDAVKSSGRSLRVPDELLPAIWPE